MGNDTALCASDLGVRYKFGTTEGEKEWLSGFYATPNEALGFFEFLVGIQALLGTPDQSKTRSESQCCCAALLFAFSRADFWDMFTMNSTPDSLGRLRKVGGCLDDARTDGIAEVRPLRAFQCCANRFKVHKVAKYHFCSLSCAEKENFEPPNMKI